MTLKPVAFALSLCLVLAGCGSPLLQVAAAKVSGPAVSPAVKPAKGSPQISMTLVSRGIKFPMNLLDTQGDVQLWAAADGAQVALKSGVLIQSRGFGMDLMSADLPSLAALMADHSRTHHYLDGADTPIRRAYTCSAETMPLDAEMPGTKHIQEICKSDAGKITNDFWFSSAKRLVKSRQWVSQGVGYAIFDTGPAG